MKQAISQKALLDILKARRNSAIVMGQMPEVGM
jgi:hypothetical protein